MVAHPETNRAACGHLACSRLPVEVIRKMPTTGNDIAHSSGRGSLDGDSAVPETYARSLVSPSCVSPFNRRKSLFNLEIRPFARYYFTPSYTRCYYSPCALPASVCAVRKRRALPPPLLVLHSQNPVLCFHGLTSCFSRKSVILITFHIARGCGGPRFFSPPATRHSPLSQFLSPL